MMTYYDVWETKEQKDGRGAPPKTPDAQAP